MASSSDGARGLHGDPRKARINPARADPAFPDFERAAHLENAIENLGQQQRVENVAANLDFFNRAVGGVCWLNHHVPQSLAYRKSRSIVRYEILAIRGRRLL